VAHLQEAKRKVEEEKTAVEEDRATQLLLNKAQVSCRLPACSIVVILCKISCMQHASIATAASPCQQKPFVSALL